MDYIELDITFDKTKPFHDILYAELASVGFESFTHTDDGIKAYIPSDKFDSTLLNDLHFLSHNKSELTMKETLIGHRNWNAEWEQSFQPVNIEDKVYIRAPFHPEYPGSICEIIIEPKMAFGTGHHETTALMIRQMLDMDLEGKRVADIGCGTGILAIYAAKCNAASVKAIDVDQWACNIAEENAIINKVDNIEVMHGDITLLQGQKFDLILANINRNILVDDMPALSDCLAEKGVIVLSGFYEPDEIIISQSALKSGLLRKKIVQENDWLSALYAHQTVSEQIS